MAFQADAFQNEPTHGVAGFQVEGIETGIRLIKLRDNTLPYTIDRDSYTRTVSNWRIR